MQSTFKYGSFDALSTKVLEKLIGGDLFWTLPQTFKPG